VTSGSTLHWRIPAGQRLLFEDFDDGIVVFDTLVGSTHLLNASAAETLDIIESSPGIETRAIHRALLARLCIAEDTLPLAALEELLERLDNLGLVCATVA
jgi:PqqD family protein of HPr-rel-A system